MTARPEGAFPSYRTKPWGGKRFDHVLYELVDGEWRVNSRWETREKAEFRSACYSARKMKVRYEG